MPNGNLDLVKLHSNERLDIPDAQSIVRSVQRHARALVNSAVSAAAVPISGFTVTTATPNIVVTRNSGAFISSNDDDTAPSPGGLGQLCNQGSTSQNEDMTAKGAGTYRVWVKFQETEGDQDNRAFCVWHCRVSPGVLGWGWCLQCSRRYPLRPL